MVNEIKTEVIDDQTDHARAGTIPSSEFKWDTERQSSGKTDNFLFFAERYLPFLSFSFFILGISIGLLFPIFASFINSLMGIFIDSYRYIAPVVIYIVLTPMLIKIFALSKVSERKFAVHSLLWFAKARIFACLFASIATSLVFSLPLYSDVSGFQDTIIESFRLLAVMLYGNVYFYAFYAATVTGLVAMKWKRITALSLRGMEAVEYFGRIIVPLIPLFMLGVGAYITTIPGMIGQIVINGNVSSKIGSVMIFGVSVDVTKPFGMIFVYIFGAFLTGAVCGIWHCGLLMMAKMSMPTFSFKKYFSQYWIKIYPLLWATSSEALSTPFNLYLVKKNYPDIQAEVRHFVVGTGSILNINGTMINVFIMTAIVAAMLGIHLSFMQLLFSIPIVFLLGYGVPGIPGELVIFAGTMALCANAPHELTPIFLSLYIGLQIGLPDSFRTAANSTDECLSAIILNAKYSPQKE